MKPSTQWQTIPDCTPAMDQHPFGAEGLATMFETRGVWNATRCCQQSERINQERLQSYRLNAKGQTVQRLAQLIVDDTMFGSHPKIVCGEA